MIKNYGYLGMPFTTEKLAVKGSSPVRTFVTLRIDVEHESQVGRILYCNTDFDTSLEAVKYATDIIEDFINGAPIDSRSMVEELGFDDSVQRWLS